jgi:serine/threonine protein kinase
MAPAVGARLGPDEVIAPLGAGGMGQVYRARDSRLGRDVALKILSDLVFLTSGDLEATAQGGVSARLSVAPGQIRHVRRDLVETVRAVRGSPRAMIFAFK